MAASAQPSLVARGVRRVLGRTFKRDTPTLEQTVKHLRRMVDGVPALGPLPRGVARREISEDEMPGVRGEWVGVPAARRTILHHHGGAYVAGGPKGYRHLGGRLARDLCAQVLLARYRLAPEHPHPAALDDAFHTYRAVLERCDPAALAVSGDSAGGGLTLALLQRVRDEGLPLPAAAILLSPWADLTDEAKSRSANAAADDMLAPGMLRFSAEAYLAGADPRTPSASPVFGDLSGLPPLLVTVDTSEVLLDDATRIVEGVQAAGGEATLLQREGLFHVWPVLAPLLPEARETASEMARFLDARLA